MIDQPECIDYIIIALALVDTGCRVDWRMIDQPGCIDYIIIALALVDTGCRVDRFGPFTWAPDRTRNSSSVVRKRRMLELFGDPTGRKLGCSPYKMPSGLPSVSP